MQYIMITYVKCWSALASAGQGGGWDGLTVMFTVFRPQTGIWEGGE